MKLVAVQVHLHPAAQPAVQLAGLPAVQLVALQAVQPVGQQVVGFYLVLLHHPDATTQISKQTFTVAKLIVEDWFAQVLQLLAALPVVQLVAVEQDVL